MYVRILLVLLSVLTVFIASSYHLAASVVGERKEFVERAKQWAAERTSITQIDEINEYRGKEHYAVVMGKNKVGTPVIAWMTEDRLIFESMENAVSKQSVLETVKKAFQPAEIVHIVPGVDGEQQFWEVVLIDSEQRYNYLYYDFWTGKLLKSYRLTPSRPS